MVLKEMTRPLSPALTEAHEMLLAAVRDFAQREIAPVAAEYDESGEYGETLLQRGGGLCH